MEERGSIINSNRLIYISGTLVKRKNISLSCCLIDFVGGVWAMFYTSWGQLIRMIFVHNDKGGCAGDTCRKSFQYVSTMGGLESKS